MFACQTGRTSKTVNGNEGFAERFHLKMQCCVGASQFPLEIGWNGFGVRLGNPGVKSWRKC